MNIESVLDHLKRRSSSVEDWAPEVGLNGDIAYVRLRSPEDATQWAVVSSPGDWWFSVDVPRGFSLDRFDEGLDDEEVTEILDELIEVAEEYLKSGGTPVRQGWFRSPRILVTTSRGEHILRLSLVGELGRMLRRTRLAQPDRPLLS